MFSQIELLFVIMSLPIVPFQLLIPVRINQLLIRVVLIKLVQPILCLLKDRINVVVKLSS